MKADTASDYKIATVVSSIVILHMLVGTQKEDIGKSYYVFIRMYFPFGGFVPYRTKRIRGRAEIVGVNDFCKKYLRSHLPIMPLRVSHYALKSTKMCNLGSCTV